MAAEPGAVLITGASTGIGRACALHLAGLGHRVFAGVRKEADGAALVAEASKVTPVLLDVVKAASIDAAARTVAEALGAAPLAGLVNNAGVSGGGPQEYLGLDEWRRVFEVNLFGAVAVTKAFMPLLRRAASGARIVNMSSISGRVAAPFLGPYCASKHALEAVTASLRLELRPWGMHAATVEPGAVLTPIWDKAEHDLEASKARMPAGLNERYGATLEKMLPRLIAKSRKHGCAPLRVAEAVAHALTSKRPRCRYLVGTDARGGAFAQWLTSDKLFDRVLLNDLGLP